MLDLFMWLITCKPKVYCCHSWLSSLIIPEFSIVRSVGFRCTKTDRSLKSPSLLFTACIVYSLRRSFDFWSSSVFVYYPESSIQTMRNQWSRIDPTEFIRISVKYIRHEFPSSVHVVREGRHLASTNSRSQFHTILRLYTSIKTAIKAFDSKVIRVRDAYNGRVYFIMPG